MPNKNSTAERPKQHDDDDDDGGDVDGDDGDDEGDDDFLLLTVEQSHFLATTGAHGTPRQWVK